MLDWRASLRNSNASPETRAVVQRGLLGSRLRNSSSLVPAGAPTEKTLEDQLFSKRQRVAPRGKPSRVHAKAVAGWSAQNGRNGDSLPEKYCGSFSFEAAMDSAARGCEGSVT